MSIRQYSLPNLSPNRLLLIGHLFQGKLSSYHGGNSQKAYILSLLPGVSDPSPEQNFSFYSSGVITIKGKLPGFLRPGLQRLFSRPQIGSVRPSTGFESLDFKIHHSFSRGSASDERSDPGGSGLTSKESLSQRGVLASIPLFKLGNRHSPSWSSEQFPLFFSSGKG